MYLTANANQIAQAIDMHIRACGGSYNNWYCGIASDPNDRLINSHNANSQNNAARFWNCGSDDIARQIEQHFIAKGCQGGGGGGDYQTRYVYVYKITSATRE